MSSTFTSKIVLKGEDRTKGAFKSVRSSIGGVASAAGALVGILGGGSLLLAGKQAIDSADKIQKLSLRLGASTEALSQYQHVAELTGVSFQTLTTGMQRATRRISEFAATGKGQAGPALKELGLSAEALARLKPEEQFEAIADAMGGVSEQGDKVRLAMSLWDTEGVALLQTIEGGSAAIHQMRDQADLLGKTLSQDAADGAARANDAITRFKAGISGTVQTLAIQFTPMIEGVANFLSRQVPLAIQHAKRAFFVLRKTLIDMVAQVTGVLAKFYDVLGQLPGALGRTYEGAARDIRRLTSIVDDQSDFVQGQINDISNETHELSIKLGKMADVAEVDAIPAVVDLANNLGVATDKTEDATTAVKELTVSIGEMMAKGVQDTANEFEQFGDTAIEVLARITEEIDRFNEATAGAIQGIGGIAGIEIPGALAQDIAGRLPPGAGQVLQDMFAGAQYAGFGSQFVGAGSEDGAAIGGALGSAFGPIGSAVGSIIGALIDGEDNPNSQIVTGSFPNRAASDDRIESQFGDVFVRSGADGFWQMQDQVTQAISTLLDGLASNLTADQIGEVVLPSTFNIDADSVRSGAFLEPFLDAVLQVMDPAIQSFVGQFEGLQTRLDALDAANFTFQQLDADPLQAFAELMAIAGESTMETMARLGDELGTLGDNAFNSIADMQALGVSLAEYNQFVIQSLAGIESARQNVSQIGSSTRDNLLFQTLDNPGQFEFLTRRANQLSAGIGELGTAAEVQSTVAQINQLLTQAFGLADPAQQAQLLEQFSGFSSATEAEAQARLDVLQAQIEERAEADRQAISDSVRQGVADGYVDAGFGDAAGTIVDAGNVIGLAGKQMQQAANTLVSTPLSVSISYSEIASVA